MKTATGRVLVGLAGWSEATGRQSAFFPAPKSTGLPPLSRYASAFGFVEINSSFYRQVRASTYARWADSVPADFRFSVKMHRLVTHYTRLKRPDLLEAFFASVAGLGRKMAAVLVQLPPSLAFDPEVAEHFFDGLRRHYAGCVACEPRHASWDGPGAAELLRCRRIGRVHTLVPPPEAEAGVPGVPVYVRLHGAPRRYYSAYSTDELRQLCAFLEANPRRRRFVVFDNTASSAAVRNAAELRGLLSPSEARP